jgi:hypothetical protein
VFERLTGKPRKMLIAARRAGIASCVLRIGELVIAGARRLRLL